METPRRKEIEDRLHGELKEIANRQRRRIVDALGNEIDPARIDPEWWADYQLTLEEALAVGLLFLLRHSAEHHIGLASQVDPRTPLASELRGAVLQAGRDFAFQQAEQVAQSMAETAQERVVRVADEARISPGISRRKLELAREQSRQRRSEPGSRPLPWDRPNDFRFPEPVQEGPITRMELDALLAIALARQADQAATTESTRAEAYGGEIGIDLTVGISLADVWHVETDADGRPDDRVCPICEPLHLTERDFWGNLYIDGPPAHVNCRCFIEYALLDPARQAVDRFRSSATF